MEIHSCTCICFNVSCQTKTLPFSCLFQLHYGIFLDGYTFSLLLDSFLKKKDYKGKFGSWACSIGVVNESGGM